MKLKKHLHDTKYEPVEPEETLKTMFESVVVMEKPNVKWSDVAGHESAKESLTRDVILPIKFPQLVTGKRITDILLVGVPGSGKTYLAKAVATEANISTFILVSSSRLVSVWLGESLNTFRRLVSKLFNLAKEQKPSMIFLDEVEYLIATQSDSESVKRLKLELLIQIQGSGRDMSGITVFAATDAPWALDYVGSAGLSQRFQSRIYVGLPDEKARKAVFKNYLRDKRHNLTDEDFGFLATNTEWYSVTDILLLVNDAPIRVVQSATHYHKVQGPSRADSNVIVDDLLTPCSPGSKGAIKMSWVDVPEDKLLEPTICMSDLLRSLNNYKPSTTEDEVQKLKDFMANNV